MFPSDQVIRVSSFDGQTIWTERNTVLLEVGNYLGGGVAGTVYECEYVKSKGKYALKVLNPLGYKLMTQGLLQKCTVLSRGKVAFDDRTILSKDHVWWLLNSTTKQYISAYFNETLNCLNELSLYQCVQIWGTEPQEINRIDDEDPSTNLEPFISNGQRVYVPKLPPKFVEFVRKRSRIFREIKNMRKISNHPNVIRLEGVLELLQDTKCTIFLVMELANGGELFDRIRVDCGTREETAKFFFQQLLGGVKHCHDQGVCHRDLKPENLLLQDTHDRGTVLKIADFGFSARFAMAVGNDDHWSNNISNPSQNYFQERDSSDSHSAGSPVRVLKSIVGSPFYVAPEILQARGYDGPKADIWSLGVILYAMLAGNLPFGQDLTVCKRFKTFCRWVRQFNLKTTQLWDSSLDFPDWLFPPRFSASSKGLIVSMLHPEPLFRISIIDAMRHPLCVPPPQPAPPVAPSVLAPAAPQASNLMQDIADVVIECQEPSAAHEDMEVEDSHETDDIIDDADDKEGDDDQSGVFVMEDDDAEYSPHVSPNNPVTTTPKSEPVDDRNISNTSRYECQSPSEAISGSCPSRSSLSWFGSSTPGTKPPIAQDIIVPNSIDDLIPNTTLDQEEFDTELRKNSQFNQLMSDHVQGLSSTLLRRDRSNDQPPSFNDCVKKSTRFITAVPAHEVLIKVENILIECRDSKTSTPLGLIGKVELNWDTFRLDVWGQDTSTPSVCALQLYQLPPNMTDYHPSTPPAALFALNSQSIPIVSQSGQSLVQGGLIASLSYQSGGVLSMPQDLYLVEFVRSQLDIFAFKRFYQWLRQCLSELVKKDYAVKLFEQAGSPKGEKFFTRNIQSFS